MKMDPYKVDGPWLFVASVNLNMAPPFVLIRVMLLVHTNTSCRYKRVEPRHIRLTKIVFDDNLILAISINYLFHSIKLI